MQEDALIGVENQAHGKQTAQNPLHVLDESFYGLMTYYYVVHPGDHPPLDPLDFAIRRPTEAFLERVNW